jgi:Ca2+-binding RTX toxin-like protein
MANLFGDNLANNLVGTLAADKLFGAGGNDTLNGGGGNDTINGDSGNDSLISGAGVDFVYGGEGNDTLEALAGGLDDLFGGIGDDVYIVNTTGDNLVEGPNQGTDLVRSSVTYILDANVENLLLTGAGAADGTGNVLNNLITGNSANNNLSGADGNDTLNGEGGNDSLNGGAGVDFLNGGAGNDTLEALAAGLDNLFGGIGDDLYIVNRTGDNLVENFNQGIDTVNSSVTYPLGANVENLLLTGAGAVNGTGNALNNRITGNSASNNLSGLGGNDTLSGKGGSDILTGGLGSDVFDFDTDLPGAGVDTINDFVVGSDKIFLSKAVFSALETFPAVGNVLLPTDFASINVAAALEVAIAGNNPNEIVYNRLTGSLFYNANDAAAGFGAGGGKFATIVGSPDTLSNTDFTVTV